MRPVASSRISSTFFSCASPRHNCPKRNSTLGIRRRGLDERAIELGARHRIDDFFGPHAVHLQLRGAVVLMHHAPAHGDGERHDALEHAGEFQSADAARGEREVDRAPAIDRRQTRIRPALVHGDFEAALREQDGQQRSREPGADDVDAGRRLQAQAISLSAAASSSTNSKMSMKRL